jgi:hypothetical protein
LQTSPAFSIHWEPPSDPPPLSHPVWLLLIASTRSFNLASNWIALIALLETIVRDVEMKMWLRDVTIVTLILAMVIRS